MEEAWLASIEVAIDKAFTAASLGMSTEELAGMAQPGQPLFGINTTNGGRIVIFGGGIPLMRDGEVVGSVGASGGTWIRTRRSPRRAWLPSASLSAISRR